MTCIPSEVVSDSATSVIKHRFKGQLYFGNAVSTITHLIKSYNEYFESDKANDCTAVVGSITRCHRHEVRVDYAK